MSGRPNGGFTLVEVLVALVFLTVILISFGASSQYANRIINASRTELAAHQFMEIETERLRILAWDSLADGTRARGRGIASWTVQDSTSFRQVLLVTRYGSPASGLVVDSVVLFRRR